MRNWYSLCCLIGGLLWGIKPMYDWLVLGRRINTGYLPPYDWTDYIKFVFPLLCLGGVYVLIGRFKKQLKVSMYILSISLILHSLFHFSEIYLYGSEIPFGLLFLLTGMITLLIGSIGVFLKGRKEPAILPRLTKWSLTLSVATLLFCLLPFVSTTVDDSIEGPIMVALMMAIGFSWAWIGVAPFREEA